MPELAYFLIGVAGGAILIVLLVWIASREEPYRPLQGNRDTIR